MNTYRDMAVNLICALTSSCIGPRRSAQFFISFGSALAIRQCT